MEHWLKRIRNIKKIKQDELVARLQIAGWDVKQATISAWENNHHNIPLEDPEKAKILAGALRISVKDLLIMAGYAIQEEFSSEGIHAASIIDSLDEKEKIHALNILEQIAQMTVRERVS